MSRVSADSIKRKVGRPKRSFPTPGTNLYAAYKRALGGNWFSLRDLTKGTTTMRLQLEDYGLEIVSRPDPTGPTTAIELRCVGVWIGTDLRTVDEVKVAMGEILKEAEDAVG